jgi:TRAP-type C4-dicarboxylate transport system substrate-binding protein
MLVSRCARRGGPAVAQQKLKWAHVYEISGPTTESVWAAAEIKKRTNGKFDIEVSPASTLGKETDINQGLTRHRRHDRSAARRSPRNYPRLGIAYYPFISAMAITWSRIRRATCSRKWSMPIARRPASR